MIKTYQSVNDSCDNTIASKDFAIEICGLTKQFGVRKALDNVEFNLPKGAFLSIFGPNGAGKTTLLTVLATLSRPTAGKIKILGHDLGEDADKIRAQIGLISHQSMLYPDLTAQENLLFIARLYGIANPNKRVTDALDRVELKVRRHDAVRTFSRGMTQRLAIARALICDPKLVFLDEPYSGLDPHAVDILDSLLAEIAFGRSFVMVSHDLQKGFDLSSHVLMLAKGRLKLFDKTENIDFDEFAKSYRETVGMGVA